MHFHHCYTLLCYSQIRQRTTTTVRKEHFLSSSRRKDSYKLERCKLDLHYPTDKKDLPPLSGSTAEDWKPEKTFSEGVPGARLRRDSRKLPTQPACPNPAYTEDAAEAVAWTFENIEEFGGDKDKYT